MSNIYKDMSPEDQEALLSTFLIDSWSYSKVSTFARNQIAFEMQYVFGLYGRSGASAMAGKAYHKALEVHFTSMMEGGVLVPLAELDAIAYQHLETIPANQWKLGKTTPTMEKAVEAALKKVTKLNHNFYGERDDYEGDIAEVLAVELRFDEWLTVNGVPIPLPCHGVLDRVVRTKRGTIAIIDDKSKDSYTDEKAQELVIGPQAITYVLGYEAKTGQKVDEVWFMENKASQNQDGTVQIRAIKKVIDANTRVLYEALLYTNLRQMISAVRDPDYAYTVNLMDPMMDMAEMADFFYRTMICEVEDFNVDASKKHLVAQRLKKIRDSNVKMIPPAVIKAFKEKAAQFIQYDLSVTNMTPQEKIEHVFRNFAVQARVAHTFEGYSSNTFLLEVSAGVKIASLFKYRLDLANGLDVENVRISNTLVRHQGKSYLAVEMAKERTGFLPYTEDDLVDMKIPLGKDNFGNVVYWDVKNPSTPHALFCGSSGSGKTEMLKNTIRYAKKAGFTQIVVFDTKYTFNNFAGKNVIVLNEISEIEKMAEMLVRHMNKNDADGKVEWILMVFDEFADAYDQARSGPDLKIYEQVVVGNYSNGSPKYQQKCTGEIKSLQENMRMLLQKGRSSGIRIAQATQRASAKIIDGDAKVNFPVQICLKVPKEVDSKVVLDEPGAESLRGNGDALIKSPEYSDVIRFQAYYKPETVTA